MPYDEIAEIMGIPLGTVKTYIHRARNELRHTAGAFEGLKPAGRPGRTEVRGARRRAVQPRPAPPPTETRLIMEQPA